MIEASLRQGYRTNNKVDVYWTYNVFSGLTEDSVRVTYCRTLAEFEQAMLLVSDIQIFGLDIERKTGEGPRIQDKASVSQIA